MTPGRHAALATSSSCRRGDEKRERERERERERDVYVYIALDEANAAECLRVGLARFRFTKISGAGIPIWRGEKEDSGERGISERYKWMPRGGSLVD